jgi:hypothetical protein
VSFAAAAPPAGDQIPRGPDLAGKVAVCRSELIPVVRMLLAFCMLAAFVCLWSSFEDFNCFAACCVLYSLSLPTLICIRSPAVPYYGTTVRTLRRPVTVPTTGRVSRNRSNWYSSTSI